MKIGRITDNGFFIFVLASALRILAIFVLESYTKPALHFDSLLIARNVVAGRGFSYSYMWTGEPKTTTWKGPLYVMFVAGFFLAAGVGARAYLGIQIAQALLGGATAVFIRKTGQSFSSRTGHIAGLLWALFPVSIVTATRMHEINFVLFLVASFVWCLIKLSQDWTWRLAGITGVALGFLILSEPIFVPFCLAAFFYLGLLRGKASIRLLARLTAAGVISMAVVAPWTIRNLVTQKTFILVKGQLGLNLWVGNNPHANGTDRIVVRGEEGKETVVHMTQTMDPDLRRRVEDAKTEVEQDAVLGQVAIRHIRDNPGKTLRLALLKIRYLWWRHPTHPLGRNVFYQLCEILLLLAAVAGAVIALRTGSVLPVLVFLLMGTLTMTYAVFYATPRARQLADPLLMVACASAAECLFLRLSHTAWLRRNAANLTND